MSKHPVLIGLLAVLLACAVFSSQPVDGDAPAGDDGTFAFVIDEENSTATVTDIVGGISGSIADVPDRVEYDGRGYEVTAVSVGKGWGDITMMTLPGTVSSVSLGEGTAADLTEFVLREKNQYLSVDEDGILYSADGRTLKAVPWGYEGDVLISDEARNAEYDALSHLAKVTSIIFPSGFEDSNLRIADDPCLTIINFSQGMDGVGLVLEPDEALNELLFDDHYFEIEGITLKPSEEREGDAARIFYKTGENEFSEKASADDTDFVGWFLIFAAAAAMAVVLFLALRKTKRSEPDLLGPLDEQDDEDRTSDYRGHDSYGDSDEDLRHAVGADQDERSDGRRAGNQVFHVGSDEYPCDVRGHESHESDRSCESDHGGGHHGDDEERYRANALNFDTEAGGTPVPAGHDADVLREELKQDQGHDDDACDDPYVAPRGRPQGSDVPDVQLLHVLRVRQGGHERRRRPEDVHDGDPGQDHRRGGDPLVLGYQHDREGRDHGEDDGVQGDGEVVVVPGGDQREPQDEHERRSEGRSGRDSGGVRVRQGVAHERLHHGTAHGQSGTADHTHDGTGHVVFPYHQFGDPIVYDGSVEMRREDAPYDIGRYGVQLGEEDRGERYACGHGYGQSGDGDLPSVDIPAFELQWGEVLFHRNTSP